MLTVSKIITKAGGVEKIAQAIRSTPWAVQKWPKNGIPEKHWASIRALTDVTPEDLHAANEHIRAGESDPPDEPANSEPSDADSHQDAA